MSDDAIRTESPEQAAHRLNWSLFPVMIALSMPSAPSGHIEPEPHPIHCWWLPYHRSQGRTPLLNVLAAYLQVTPQSISFDLGPQGRPALGGALRGRLDFNWSHSGQHAAIAVGHDLQVGIDIESRRRRPRMLELAQRYFAASESRHLQSLPEVERQQAFWALWTGKEAVLKAIGTGISHGLDKVVFQADAAAGWPLQTMDGAPAHGWQLLRPQLDPDYSVALAWQGAPRALRVHRL